MRGTAAALLLGAACARAPEVPTPPVAKPAAPPVASFDAAPPVASGDAGDSPDAPAPDATETPDDYADEQDALDDDVEEAPPPPPSGAAPAPHPLDARSDAEI